MEWADVCQEQDDRMTDKTNNSLTPVATRPGRLRPVASYWEGSAWRFRLRVLCFQYPVIGERMKLTTRRERIDDFIAGSPPNNQPLQILCEDHVGTYVNSIPCRWRDGLWENAKTSRRIEATVVGWRLLTKLSAELSGSQAQASLALWRRSPPGFKGARGLIGYMPSGLSMAG